MAFSTANRRFGRSKLAITCAWFRRPTREMMSCRTGRAAVAVSAMIGGWPRRSITGDGRRYFGRKSWPQADTRVGLVDHEQADHHLVLRQLLGGQEQGLGLADLGEFQASRRSDARWVELTATASGAADPSRPST